MLTWLFGDNFWLSSTPIIVIGLLAALVVLAWDWRISLPAVLLVQWGLGRLSAQRALIPEEWISVLSWVVAASLCMFVLSILQSGRSPRVGRLGTLLFRSLVLGLAAFLLYSAKIDAWLPLIDGELTRLILWVVVCALLTTASTSDALNNGLALLLWLMAAEIAILTVTPASVVVVLLGILFLVVALACSYLIMAENVGLVDLQRPTTDAVFPIRPGPTNPMFNNRFANRFANVRQWMAGPGNNGKTGNPEQESLPGEPTPARSAQREQQL